MPTKRKIVAAFSRDELWRIIDQRELPVEDRRRLDHLQAALQPLPKLELREILEKFDRDRLKEICRYLGLDDSGKIKAEIADRIIGTRDDEPDADIAPEPVPNPTSGKKGLLDALDRNELLQVVDQYSLQVEDRRVREKVREVAASLSDKQVGAVLEHFTRDRLKEICRTLELDDTGKLKSDLVDRILGELSGDKEADDSNPLPSPPPGLPRGDKHREADDSKPKLGRPRLFIGSTVEALPVAREVQSELDHEFEATIWSQSLFSPGDWTWSRLVEMARNEFDFALLVFSADDVVESRGASTPAPRDNVLLEYGLFVGTVGPERTFFLFNRDHRPKIASDLAGVTALTYGDRDDGNLQAAVGPACTSLRKRYASLGRRPSAQQSPRSRF